jgi:hypothetical protein
MRVSDKQLDQMFQSLVSEFAKRGVDTSQWGFGQHVGSSYYIARFDENDRPWQVSPYWRTKNLAYDGMMTMLHAVLIIPEVK